jgi:hypothetical protein
MTQSKPSQQILDSISDRVLNGVDHGGFVEHVANREWERALWAADQHNREAFVEIMLYRINRLPGAPAEWARPRGAHA